VVLSLKTVLFLLVCSLSSLIPKLRTSTRHRGDNLLYNRACSRVLHALRTDLSTSFLS
jgi:hypothetical protein